MLWQPAGRFSREVHVEAVGAPAGQFSDNDGAAVQVPAASAAIAAGLSWIPGPNGSFAAFAGVSGPIVTTLVNGGISSAVGKSTGRGEVRLKVGAGLDINTGAGRSA